MYKIFIDGSAGTTGLRIFERLFQRNDITLLTLPDELRKDPNAKAEKMAQSDLTFLCLPDEAAKEAAALCGDGTTIIDASTAHRVNDDWVYGMPELKGQREKIKTAKRIANPGCHASGFIALVNPLVNEGIIPKDASLSCFSLTGYSGGGKGMIARYEEADRDPLYLGGRMYALTQSHKHIPEMIKLCSLKKQPVFCPVVEPYYSGMQVTVCVPKEYLSGSIKDVEDIYSQYYKDGAIRFSPDSEEGFLSAVKLSGKDSMSVSAFGNDNALTLVSRFDNLGKGASGAAIQNMNIALGCDEYLGLDL